MHVHDIDMKENADNIVAPFGKPLYVAAKPVGAHCNLSCRYCYYIEKSRLYDDVGKHLMSNELLELFVKEYIQSQTMSQILFTWHGGEPLMRPISFYNRALQLQKRYACGVQISNCIQTNGTLLTDDWCRFFADNDWLVGVSIDGPQEFHDEYRLSRMGKPTWRQVMKGIEKLNKYNVQWNAMATVNDFNADYPLEFYNFFKSIDCHYIQFTPIVERIVTENDAKGKSLKRLASVKDEKGDIADYSVTPEQWGNFCTRLFDEWVANDVGEYFVQLFDATLANWIGEMPGVCSLSNTCGHASAMEFNGDVYSCDHFVFPEYKLGNIRENTLTELLYGEKQTEFGAQKTKSLPRQCRQCKWLFACHGECPKNRFATTADGEPYLNYLCDGYRQFFTHVAPAMDFMKAELSAGRPPSNVMRK